MAEIKRKKVVIAVDESDESIYALRWALEHTVQPTDEVVLLHVQPPPQLYAGGGGPVGFYATPELLISMKKHQERATELILENAKKICEESKQINATTLVKVGDPRDLICETVEKEHADLLILGSHGYGAIKRAFLGSVSDYCAHRSKCPVLVVKKNHK
ncbi:hypothetical protein O6H91_11G030100 [Diphasiastrum complanatum]|uniref:Uncharacterized protein n=1 Tax=Diphasiastrum complanatum TaxID=34168 RepID=A0ACC2C7G8_DIPCM|nr:hypothetical protein O6H91_11G030100 [Diphasiastrum complanatum]